MGEVVLVEVYRWRYGWWILEGRGDVYIYSKKVRIVVVYC